MTKKAVFKLLTIFVLSTLLGVSIAMACDYIADGSATAAKDLESPFGQPANPTNTGGDQSGDLNQSTPKPNGT